MPYYPDKAGQLILLDIVNDLQDIVYQPGDLTFGLPEPAVNHNRNTVVTAQPAQGQGFLIYYNRLELQQLFGVLNLQIPDNAFETTRDLIPYLNTLYVGTQFVPEDIQDLTITPGAGARSVTLIANMNSYLVRGECVVTIAGTDSHLQILTVEGQPLLTLENEPILIVE